MKKLLSILLSAVLILSVAVPVAVASENEVYPIIIVPGYSSSSLYKLDENGNKVHVWGVEMDKILHAIVINAAEIGIGIGAYAKGDAKRLADTVGREFVRMYGDMSYDEYGQPVTPLNTYYNTAAKTSTAWLKENEDGQYIHEREIMPYVAQYLGDKADEWTFNFNTDFRRNSEDCAADLDRYIDSVLAYTGAKKVNILAVSHGGQTTASYLALYGGEKCNNVVLTVPAIGGALLAYDLYNDSVRLDEETLFYFIENGEAMEEDMNWLVKAHEFGFLDDFIHYLRPYVLDILGYWGSIWDFIPAEYFDKISKTVGEEFLQSEVYAKSVKFHKETLPNLSASLKKAENDGANIYLLCGTSWPSVVGTQENSDAIISVNSSSGATCAPLDERFSDGYETINTVCADKTHNHLSPAMDIDASTCYLPETTWFVRGLFHGMTLSDNNYSAPLMKMLVESKERVNVRTYEEYPQFHDAMNTCETVYAEFDVSKTGYISAGDTSIKITNLSNKSSITVLSISAENAELSFPAKEYVGKTVAPGETLTVKFSGKLPEKSYTVAGVKISYGIGTVTPVGEKEFYFTVMNGEKPDYDNANPYTPLKAESQFKNHIENKQLVELFDKLGLTPFLEIIYNIVFNLVGKFLKNFI